MNPLLPKSDLNRAASVPSTLPLQEKSPLHGSTAVQGLVTALRPKSILKTAASAPSQSTSPSKLPSHSQAVPHPFPPGGKVSSWRGLETLGQLSQAFPDHRYPYPPRAYCKHPRCRTNRCSCMVLLSYRPCRCPQPGHWPLSSSYHHHQQSRHNRHLSLK